MEDRNYYINQGIDNSGVSEVERFNKINDYIRQQDPTFLMEESRLRPNSGTYFGASSSKFDSNLPSVDQLMAEGLTADQARGIEQPVFNRIGNALVNNAVIAGTTAISGSLGVIWGAIDALANQELNKLYDNPVNKKMLEWQEATAKAAPNYYTKEYEESSIWKKLGTSIFWADLIKNLGFTEGMLVPGMGVSAALSKTPMAMQLIGSSIASALSEASIEAIQAKQDKLNLENTQIANEYNKAILAAKSPEEKRLIDQEYNKTLQGIEDDANKVGNYVLGYNMALLTATNSLEWGKLFTRGNKASRAAILAKERSQGIKAAKDGLSLNIEQPWLNTVKNLGSRGYQAFTEGMEEVLQDVAVKSADLNPNYNSFNESVFNPKKRELANSSLQSLGMAFSQAMKDSDTATDFAMGFFTSVLGSPRFRGPKENGKWRSPVTMEGGVTEFLRERREYGKRKALVDEINKRLSDPTFEEYYKGIVRDSDLTDKANLALEAGDEFNFHNYQFASMISDIIMFDNVGQFALFNNILDKASAISDSEIKSLIDSGLFQQNGNPMSEEDARNKIQENVELMRGLASQYREIKENLEASDNGSQLSKDALENIIYAKMQLDNWRKRQTDISNELMNLYKDEIYDSTDEKAVSPEHFRLLATLPVIRDELKRLVEESELTDDVKETWIKKIEDLNKIQDNMKKFSDKINEYYSSPQKANIAQEKIKEKAVKNDQKRKVDIAKEQLQKATTPKALRNTYNGILNQGDLTEAELTKAVNELIEEGNTVAVENKNIQSLYQGTVAKISNMGLDNQETSNAIQMLNTAMNNARNIAEMIEPSNPSYTEISTFFNSENPSSGNPVLDKETFLKAQVIVAKALQEQLKEMGKNVEAAKFTTTENPAPGTNESGTTGNSGVSEAPSAKGHDSIPSASITSENGEPGVSAGNLPANYDNSGVEQQPDTNESQKKEMDEETPIDPNKSWFPLSWFFLGSKKKGVLIPISDTQAIQKEDASVNFGQIPQWIEQNRVQEHVDTGHLKIGDKLVLGIPSDLKDINGNPVIVYYKVIGDDYMPVGIFTASGNLAKNIKSKVLEEYKKADQSKSFFSSITTTVNDVKTGYVEYGESRNLDSTDNITFAIVRNGSLDLGASSIKLNEVNRPKNISQKNGMVYIAIPNSRKGMSGGYTLVGAKVKKFNSKEFDLTSPKNAESPVVKNIRKSVEAIINAKTQADLLNRLQELSKYLYIPNLNFYIVGDGIIRVTRNVLDSSGKVIKKLVKKADGTSVYENSETVVGVYKDPESLFGDLYKMGLNFNIDRTSINTPEYNKTIIDSGIVSINAVNTNHTVGGWFTANPVGENGEIKGSKIPFNNPTPSNTPQSNDNSIIVTINNKQVTLFPTGEYLSLKDGVRRLPTNSSDVERYKALYTLQKQYGNATEGSTMWNNKAVINGKVIDRTTGEWVIGAAAAEVINKVNPKPSPTSTTKETQSTDSIFQNHDDMNPIEDLSDNSKFPNSKVGYYLDSRDKKIHKTYMVSAGEILGTPIQIIKIPVLTSGLNSKGPKKVAGYNYGIVLPNGQSYIGTNLNVETPINTVFEGIRKSFEGPGVGPKGQEFVEKHKKEFTELKNMPSVFPTEVASPIGTEVKQETPATTANNDEMSFEDFAAMMGADISGNPTVKLREANEEYTQEMLDILSTAKYDKDGNILAPNGKPTNLTKRQWIQVRTKAFKEWFGDWENNPKESSKVVDENGEPLVVYHGTSSAPFNIFDKNRIGSRNLFGTHKEGFYFTDLKENAKSIAIKMRRGDLIINGEPLFKSDYPFLNSDYISEKVGYKVSDEFADRKIAKSPYDINVIKDYYKAIGKKVEVIELQEDNENIYPSFLNIREMPIKDYEGQNLMDTHFIDFDNFVKEAKEGGKLQNIKDGDFKLANTYFVKEPNQIKSAIDNNGDYSRENNNIKARKTEKDNELFLENKYSKKFDIDKEVKWLSNVLPNIPVETVEGLIHIAGKNAWGTFSNAGITLSNVAAEGTAYHEAFHAVFSLGLNGNERANLMKEAFEESKLTDPVELEEWLAERFREYVINQKSKTVGQKIKEFFKKLWNLIRGVQEAEPMRYSIYKKIMSSKYKNIRLGATEESSTRLRPEEYTPEMLNILSTAKYDKNGNILAHNGKPSNLDERKWVHVRTKAFKDWFGDWENDPTNASKAVDENGEPLVVWHSGMSEIKDNIFRNKVITTINKAEEWVTDKNIEDYIKEGYIISEEDIAKYNEGKDVEITKPNAIYASSERDVSNSYTKKSYEASIEFDEEVEDRAEQRAEDWGNEEYYLYLDFLKTTRDKELASKMTDEEMLKRHPEGKEKYISPTNPYEYKDIPIGTELALFSAIKNPLIVDAHKSNWNNISFNGGTYTTRTLEKYARNNGYDGIIVKNVLDIGPYGRLEANKFSTVVAAMNPNQIKSATDNTGTYSKENDNIRLRRIKEDNALFLENGYSENWIKNATEEEKEIAKYCIGI